MNYWAFDLDGTLVDSFAHYFSALEEIFDEHGAKFSKELREPALTNSLPQFFETHLGESKVEQALHRLEVRSHKDAAEIKPFHGIANAIEHLLSAGAKVAILTNRDLVSTELILKHTKLKRLAEICISGTCVTQRKPSPEGLLKVSNRFGCDVRHVTVVGDHLTDMEAAKAVGARAVRASWHSYWDIEQCKRADAQFFTVHEFTSWVRANQPENRTSRPS